MWVAEDSILQFDCSIEHYRSIPGGERGKPDFVMSRSELLRFAECPHKWTLGIPRKVSDEMKFGDLVDCMLTSNGDQEDRFIVTPETYIDNKLICPKCGSEGRGGAKKCSACKTERELQDVELPWNANANTCKEMLKGWYTAGKTVVSAQMLKDALKSKDWFLFAHDGWISNFARDSRKQTFIQLQWVDSAGTVIPFKLLIDFMPHSEAEFTDGEGNCYTGVLGELKTARSAQYNAWRRHLWELQYHVQAAIYLDAASAVTECDYSSMVHLIGENTPPFVWTYRFLDPDFIEMGRAVYQSALDEYCRCVRSGSWGEYDCAPARPEPWMLGVALPRYMESAMDYTQI